MKTFVGVILICSAYEVQAASDVMPYGPRVGSSFPAKVQSGLALVPGDASLESKALVPQVDTAPKKELILAEKGRIAALLQEAERKNQEFSIDHYRKYMNAFEALLPQVDSTPGMDVEAAIVNVHRKHNALWGDYQ